MPGKLLVSLLFVGIYGGISKVKSSVFFCPKNLYSSKKSTNFAAQNARWFISNDSQINNQLKYLQQ